MKFLTLFTLFFSLSTSVFASDSILRVSCSPQDSGAKIYINGKLRGECPVDIMIDAGPVTLEAVKQVDAEYEQRFSQQFTIYASVAKRVTVTLSAPQLTAEAIETRKIASLIQKTKEAEAQKTREIAAFRRDKSLAEAGSIIAMDALTDYYKNGIGTGKDPAQAEGWRIKAKTAKKKAKHNRELAEAQRDLKSARAGNISAMESMARHYTYGTGVEKDTASASKWRQRAQEAKEKVRQQKAEQEERAASAHKRAEIQKKIDDIDYLSTCNKFIKRIREDNTDPIVFTCSIPASPFAIVFDLISAPTRTVQKLMLSKELNAHAAAWAQPDSMMDRVYRKQQTDHLKIATQ